MYAQISEQISWFSIFALNDSAKSESVLWLSCSNLYQCNGRSIWFKSSPVRIVHSDSSGTGYDSYVVELGAQVASGVWSSDVANQSSKSREISAVSKVLRSFAHNLAGLCVKLCSDGQNVDVLSLKLLLQEVRRIFDICVYRGISIEPTWVPRASNEQAG